MANRVVSSESINFVFLTHINFRDLPGSALEARLWQLAAEWLCHKSFPGNIEPFFSNSGWPSERETHCDLDAIPFAWLSERAKVPASFLGKGEERVGFKATSEQSERSMSTDTPVAWVTRSPSGFSHRDLGNEPTLMRDTIP